MLMVQGVVRVLFFSALIVIPLAGCQDTGATGKPQNNPPQLPSQSDYLEMAVLYHQQAAEYRALCFQAFNTARERIDMVSRQMGLSRKQAVVVDIDETMLDNSPYEAELVLRGEHYPAYWDEWMNKADARPLPGALDFVHYVADKQMEVFYVTNRREKYRRQTLENLKKFDFPFADDQHLLMRSDESSKEPRRKLIEENYNIVLLIGDNLSDFSDAFDRLSITGRSEATSKLAKEFGKRYIILPNAMYGDWEGAVYNNDYTLSPEEKQKLRRDHLKGFLIIE
ncbi:MAG: 5'-nucleotidase, lipoprotein e(P4) family [Bacteroidales bacterium]